MENASKALIIAGAILIAILLIGLGVLLIRNSTQPIEQAAKLGTQQTIESFNAKFTNYAGVQNSTNTKELITKIASSNGATNQKIEPLNCVVPNADVTNLGSIQANILSNKTYSIQFSYASNGYINKVTIIQK